MKAFVYKKNGNSLVKVITNVIYVVEKGSTVAIESADSGTSVVDKKVYKTTIYQN